jgi:rhodanese-related sulfurtransferase
MKEVQVRIGLQEAREHLDSGKAVALDVTSSLVWPALQHRIPGAIRIPPEEIIRALDGARPAEQILPMFGDLPRDKQIIAFCTCPGEETSVRLTEFLRRHGYHAYALYGGLAAWRAAGYPMVEKQAVPAPAPDQECPDCEEEVASHAIA